MNKVDSIERRFNRLLKDCEKEDLVIISIGDGCNLIVYKREDYNRGNLDQISGITDCFGCEIEPLFSLNSRAIH